MDADASEFETDDGGVGFQFFTFTYALFDFPSLPQRWLENIQTPKLIADIRATVGQNRTRVAETFSSFFHW